MTPLKIPLATLAASTMMVMSPVFAAETPAETGKVTQLQKEFRDLKFGMFLHYNMATYYDGGQWVEGYACPSTFQPGGRIDTDAWADAAVSAGMTYGVLTAKHVSGFCLWDSKYTKKRKPFVDIAVTETFHFPEDNTAPGETCWTLEEKWFWREGDKIKSAEEIVKELKIAESRNANFLLNVGPNRQGKFEEASVNALAEIGKLLKEEYPIDKTTGNPVPPPDFEESIK